MISMRVLRDKEAVSRDSHVLIGLESTIFFSFDNDDTWQGSIICLCFDWRNHCRCLELFIFLLNDRTVMLFSDRILLAGVEPPVGTPGSICLEIL